MGNYWEAGNCGCISWMDEQTNTFLNSKEKTLAFEGLQFFVDVFLRFQPFFQNEFQALKSFFKNNLTVFYTIVSINFQELWKTLI